jgi:hypothetical protein
MLVVSVVFGIMGGLPNGSGDGCGEAGVHNMESIKKFEKY